MRKSLSKGISTPISIGIVLLIFLLATGTIYWFYLDIINQDFNGGEISVPRKSNERFYCKTAQDCTKYGSCSEDCVNKDYKKNNPYEGVQCGMPWQFGCECVNSRCESG